MDTPFALLKASACSVSARALSTIRKDRFWWRLAALPATSGEFSSHITVLRGKMAACFGACPELDFAPATSAAD
jgi:hypothetical protein